MGGMAEVLLAHQRGLGGLEKLVVVKRILPHLGSDPQFVSMFLEEARIAASLGHPNIVNVIDVRREGEDLFMVMEYLAGVDLRQLMAHAREAELPLPVPLVLRVVADAAHGLHHAHRATDRDQEPLHIVHQDVTPSNIMLTFEGITKVLDFGIAKASSTVSSSAGGARGQLAYASPEQLAQRPLDARADVFSLGVILHEMLTGAPLFASESPAATIHAVLERPVPAPSAANPQVPPALDQLVSMALQREPAARTASAADLRDGLNGVLERSFGTSMSQARVARWLRASMPEACEERRALEAQATRRSADEAAPPRSSASISVSRSISADLEADTTRISLHPSISQGTDTSLGGHPMSPPEPQEGHSVWWYAAAASLATLAVVAAAGLAFFIGRSAG